MGAKEGYEMRIIGQRLITGSTTSMHSYSVVACCKFIRDESYHVCRPSFSTEISLTTCGWRTSFSTEISRSAVAGTPSSHASMRTCKGSE